MESTTTINGIPIKFPFEPYEIQKNYMQKVLECLQNGQHGVLESPTGTGKTLSLLCSSLAWLEVKKAQIQLERQSLCNDNDYLKNLNEQLAQTAGKETTGKSFLGLPTIIYASRTHSQLSQAMQELKKTAYSHMKAYILGSRDQMCIDPIVSKEPNNATKTQMCRLKVKTRSCLFYNKVENKKNDPSITNLSIIDIEDIVKLGTQHKFCPYYMTKELKHNADIIFTPYNYLLDPKTRRSLGIELENNVIILDEAHNIDSHCEESASLNIQSTDITLCIEEVTTVMRSMDSDAPNFNEDAVKDFTTDELCDLKELFLNFEKELDNVELVKDNDGLTVFPGDFIFELLTKVGIVNQNVDRIISLLDRLIQFLTTTKDNPFQRSGVGLQLFNDFLTIVFSSKGENVKDKIKVCYKVHIQHEVPKKKTADNWLSKLQTKSSGRVLSYWCFSPGFGMNMLLNQHVRCVILTSGTLAPLKPLITELEMDVKVKLENPHIVGDDQVCVKILKRGSDQELLNCNYQNRDNEKYLNSLGMSLLNLIRAIPNGVLIFFQSYPIMLKCQNLWQQNGVWAKINSVKQIYVETKNKTTFNETMNEYYLKISDPNLKGAIFMGVCRGKVSEGLDFADYNGRAVIIIGLPFPPLRDPRVILKKRYLDVRNSQDKEFLNGQEWYCLEACRAVNQAVGRVIRHRNDYGAIILMDSRFDSERIKGQMSKWLQKHINVSNNFGEILRDIRFFFKNAQEKLPQPKIKPSIAKTAEFSSTKTYRGENNKGGNFDFSTSTSTSALNFTGLVGVHNKTNKIEQPVLKKRKLVLVSNPTTKKPDLDTGLTEFIVMLKRRLDSDGFKQFLHGMETYKNNLNIEELIKTLTDIFTPRPHVRDVLIGLKPFFEKRESHSEKFLKFCEQMR